MSYKGFGRVTLPAPSLVTDVAKEAALTYHCQPLPAALITGHQTIDFEHQMLLNSMSTLRQVCSGFTLRRDCSTCPADSRADCENSLISLLGDLLVFMMDHFRTEEQLMRDSLLVMVDRDLCEAHMEDHAAISSKVQQIVAALDPMQTPSLIRQLDTLLHNWVSHHVVLHDLWLARWVERDDSILRTAFRRVV